MLVSILVLMLIDKKIQGDFMLVLKLIEKKIQVDSMLAS
jgi:hypothetical protein